MKVIYVSIILLIAIGVKSQIQTNEKEFYVLVTLLSSEMTTSSEAIDLAGKFEMLNGNKTTHWLASYYASYCYVMAAFMESNPKNIDSLALNAELALDKAEVNTEEASEIYCLRSLIASARIMVNPNERGMKYGMESTNMLNKAKAENPNNPRVYLIEGQSLLYMPQEYGGGCKNAIPVLEMAIDKYESFKLKSDISPNWGKEEAMRILDNCKSK